MRANASTSSKRASSAITRRPPTCGPTTRRFTATWECEAAMQWLHAVPWDLLLIQTINGIVTGMIPEPFSGSITLFHLDYSLYRLMIAGLSAAIIGGFWLFLKFGTWGIWIRATTQDRIMAQAMGIPVPWVLAGVFAIGSAMAGASGVLFGPLVGVDHAMGFDWILRAFIVVVVGGMGSLGGSIAAAIFISLLEAYASIWVSPAQAVIVSFVVLILTLLFRPTGLFVPTPK